ncbi:hypothetical protein V5799_009615 [Amblyomma americanum]|uniref:Uncharacterized protein n=1 Tax=Amblyomma americanum TaxID=6943 RepID=A0AAQ4F9W0_AMBAM
MWCPLSALDGDSGTTSPGARWFPPRRHTLGILQPVLLVLRRSDGGTPVFAALRHGPQTAMRYPGRCQKSFQLVLQNRLDKVHQMRIVAFVGSPVTSDKKELLSLAIKLKRENVKVDIVSFGENDLNIPTLTPFLSILNGGGYAGSHMVSVEAGNVLWRVLMNSPIVRAQDDTPFTYRINSLDFDLEDDDPELALVLRVSMEEHRQIEARRAMANAANGAALAPSSDGAGAMPAEEELLEHMSSGTGQGGAFTGMQHYEATTEDDDLAVAVEMLLSLGCK